VRSMAESSRRFAFHRALILTAGLVVASGCGDAAPVSAPGTLTATLESPNGAEGAALIHLIGAGVSFLEPLTGDLHTSVLGDTTKVLVLLDAPGEIAFLLNVADTTQPPVATLLQVADGQNQIRPGLGGYSVRFTP